MRSETIRTNGSVFRRWCLAVCLLPVGVGALLAGCSEPHPASPTLPKPTMTVAAIVAGVVSGQVVLDGKNIRSTGEPNKRVFSDGTGEILAVYPSDVVPATGTPIRVSGLATPSQIEVSQWEPL